MKHRLLQRVGRNSEAYCATNACNNLNHSPQPRDVIERSACLRADATCSQIDARLDDEHAFGAIRFAIAPCALLLLRQEGVRQGAQRLAAQPALVLTVRDPMSVQPGNQRLVRDLPFKRDIPKSPSLARGSAMASGTHNNT